MKEHPRGGFAVVDNGQKCFDYEAPIHRRFHRPTDNAPGKQIEHNSKLQPPFARRQIGDIARPNAIWTADDVDIEVPPEPFSAIGKA